MYCSRPAGLPRQNSLRRVPAHGIRKAGSRCRWTVDRSLTLRYATNASATSRVAKYQACAEQVTDDTISLGYFVSAGLRCLRCRYLMQCHVRSRFDRARRECADLPLAGPRGPRRSTPGATRRESPRQSAQRPVHLPARCERRSAPVRRFTQMHSQYTTMTI